MSDGQFIYAVNFGSGVKVGHTINPVKRELGTYYTDDSPVYAVEVDVARRAEISLLDNLKRMGRVPRRRGRNRYRNTMEVVRIFPGETIDQVYQIVKDMMDRLATINGYKLETTLGRIRIDYDYEDDFIDDNIYYMDSSDEEEIPIDDFFDSPRPSTPPYNSLDGIVLDEE